MANKAWVTLATNDTYALGALVLAHSLKKVNTAYKLVVLVSSNVTFAMRGTLQSVFDEVKEVNILDSGDTENLRLLARPELGITFTKFHCWKLTQFEKCVFLDADTLVLQNCDELFEREELSAAPDVGWPDCFNSGVFVFKPSEETFKALCDFAIAHGSFDGGDQGLLNMYFSDWATSDASKRLPFLFNLSSAAIYSYLPAFKWYGKGVKIVHFIGNSKPWQQPFNSSTRTVEAAPGSSHLQNFLQYWWDLFCAYVYPQLSPEMGGLANSLAQMKLEEPTPEQKARDDFLRKQNWEQGNIDYMGRDSFSNIWEKISQTMNFEPESKTEEKAATVQSSPASPTTTEQSSESSTKVDSVKSPTSILTSEQPISIPKSSEPAATKTVPSSPAPVPVSSQVASTTPVADESAPKSSAAPACPKPAPSAAAPVASTTPVPESTPAPTTPKPEAAPACPKPSSPAAAPVASTTPVPESTPAPTTTKPVAAPTCPKPAPSPSASAPVSSSTPVAEKSAPPPVTSKPVAAPACPKSAPSAPTPVAPTKPATESTPAPTPVCPKPAAPAAPAAKSSQEGKPAPSTKSSPSKK